MNKVVEKWDEILQIVKTEHDLSDVSFNTWLKPLTVYEVVDNVVTIIVPSEQVGLNYISKKYKLPLQVTISEVTGMENCDINFILPERGSFSKSAVSGRTLRGSSFESKIHF